MEILTSDDSNDSDYKLMKDQLTEFGFGNENLNKEEMANLLKALNDSKEQSQISKSSPAAVAAAAGAAGLRRRRVPARDVRLPWSLLAPELSAAQRARTLAAYGALVAARRHRQARLSLKMAEWAAPRPVPEREARAARCTRSGRAAPDYREPKRRRIHLYED